MQVITINGTEPKYEPISLFLSKSTTVNVLVTTNRWIFLTFKSTTVTKEGSPIRKRLTNIIFDPTIPQFIVNIAKNIECMLFINNESDGYFCEIINIGEGAHVIRRGVNVSVTDNYSFMQCNIQKNAKIKNKTLTISPAANRKVLQIEMNHLGNRSEGDVVCRQILKQGYVEVNCVSNIPKIADDCVAQQKLKSILFNKNTTAFNRPILNIYNKNVVATHASAIGCINPTEIYYLNTRGFPDEIAKFLILKGYVAEIFVGIKREFCDLLVKKIIILLNLSEKTSYITAKYW